LWEKCQKDPWYFITNYVRTINLHMEDVDYADPTVDLFPDYPYLRNLIRELVKPQNVLVEKTRDMMLTWTVCAVFFWDIMFNTAAPMLMTSRRGGDVDDGGENSTANSLLGRIRFMYTNLPDWMRERVLLRFKTGSITNQKSGSFIVGMKAMQHTGRQGKYRRIFADEFAHFDFSESNLESMKLACQKGLILGSTPGITGRFNAFGRLATTSGTGGFKKITLHWTKHPLRGKKVDPECAWYKRQCESLDAEGIARELDINYTGSVSAKCFTFDYDLNVAPGIKYSADHPIYLSADHGLNEETWLFWQRYGGIDYIIDTYQGGVPRDGRKLTVWQNRQKLCRKLIEPPYELPYVVRPGLDGEEIVVIQALGGAYGDPRGADDVISTQSRKTDDTRLTSYHAVYRQAGIRVRSQYSKIKDGLSIIERQLTLGVLKVTDTDPVLIDAFQSHRHKKDKRTGQILDGVIEDWTKHWIDAVRYYFINTRRISNLSTRKAKKVRQVWTYGPTGCRYPTNIAIS
tara:strand:+ start:674 stop:2221 length:1548 start_codon:yes stop_codon:yes gene_type:complete